MPSLRRADLDALAYRLRAEGLTYQAIAERLGVNVSMARRRVLRHERRLARRTDRMEKPPGERLRSHEKGGA